MIQAIIEQYKKFVKEKYSCQGDAAADLGISRTHLNKIIHGRSNPSTGLVIKMEKKMEEYNY